MSAECNLSCIEIERGKYHSQFAINTQHLIPEVEVQHINGQASMAQIKLG